MLISQDPSFLRSAPDIDAAELDRRAFGHGQPGVSGLAVKPAKAARSRQIDMTRPANNISI
jgi:hypothetical protein